MADIQPEPVQGLRQHWGSAETLSRAKETGQGLAVGLPCGQPGLDAQHPSESSEHLKE